MWLTLAKWALLVFIAAGLTVFVVVYLRNVGKFKAQRLRSNPDLGPSTTWAVVPPTPLPEWAEWDDDEPEDDTAPRRER